MCVHKKRDKIGRTLLMIVAGLTAAGLFAAGFVLRRRDV